MAQYNTRRPRQQEASSSTQTSSGNPPTHVAKSRVGHGEAVSFERIGVAWAKDDGSIFIRLYGTQIIADGFALYPLEDGGAR